jgi:hypothetical protein
MTIKWTIHTHFEHYKLDIVCNEAALIKIHLRIGLGDFFLIKLDDYDEFKELR